MYEPSVLSRTRLVTFAVLCGLASVLASANGWAYHAPVGALRGAEAIRQLEQEGTYESLAGAVAASGYFLARGDHPNSPDETGAYEAGNPAQALRTHFTGDEMRVRSRGEREWQLGLRLTGWGYGEHLPAVTSGRMQTRGNRREIQRRLLGNPGSAPLVEWYVHTPQGLEQGFTLAAPPTATPSVGTPKRLRVALELTGDLRGEMTGDGQAMLLTDRRGQQVARYDHLAAWDATGRVLASRMRVRGREVSLEVDDAGATYPVTIDPTLQEVKLTDPTGEAFDGFGHAVAVSGGTAIVGVAGREAHIFVRHGPSWSLQQKLPTVGVPNPGFSVSISVAISGNTAIVGATQTDGGQGVAHVFVRRGAEWSQQQVLMASDRAANDRFGQSVAISGDTVVVGAPYKASARGEAYVFVRNGETWVEQAKLHTAASQANDGFGWSVGISKDTVIVGVENDNVVGDTTQTEGSAYIFVRNGMNWPQEAFLTADSRGLGKAVAISGDAAVVGALNKAFVFERSGIQWSPGQRLAPNPDEVLAGDRYGESVGISGDRAIVGEFLANKGRGVAVVFAPQAGFWIEQIKLQASDAPAGTDPAEGWFGASVAVHGATTIVGAPGKKVGANRLQGGVYIIQEPDTDGDGLPDSWETNGVTSDGVLLDLKAMGADPLHKDVFIHADWMHASPTGDVLKPNPRAIKMVIDAFAVAPVENPDRKKGVRLHVDLGSTSIMTPGKQWGTFSRAGEVPFQDTLGAPIGSAGYDWSAFDAVKATRFEAAKRRPVFHYVLFSNTINASKPPPGLGRAGPGADFLIALGAYRNDAGIANSTVLQQALVIMHELGHNLGLQHGGGDDDINFKPNYLSVMNYAFALTGLRSPGGKQRKLDYSRQELPELDEEHLDETKGISDPAGHLTTWNSLTFGTLDGLNECVNHYTTYTTYLPYPALDWDCNGAVTTPGTVLADLNRDGRCVGPGPDGKRNTLIAINGGDEVRDEYIVSGANRICETVRNAQSDDEQLQQPGFVEPGFLSGFEDWSHLAFDGGGKLGALQIEGADLLTTPVVEATLDELAVDLPPTFLDEDVAAPQDEVTLSTEEGPAALAVDFDGRASTAVNATIVGWAWDFGDGTAGAGATITHTYMLPGEYFASLTVTDSNGRVNLVPLLQRVVVFDPTIATATPHTTPTLIALPTPTVTAPLGSTPTRTATPVLGATPTRTPTATPTPGVSLIVTTTADNGSNANPVPGSLRQAILTANATANLGGVADAISFAIPGAGVHTIRPPVSLPEITDPVRIDGYTQPGASPNTLAVGNNAVLRIELDIEDISPTGGGFSLGFSLGGVGGSTVRGVVINRFRSVGIFVRSDGNVVEGCFIATNAAGDTVLPYHGPDGTGVGGIIVDQGAGNRIGGTSPAARNVIADLGVSIRVGNGGFRAEPTNTLIQGNYLGTNAAGSAALYVGQTSGVGVDIIGAGNTTIGGTEAGAGNLISGNGAVGYGLGISIQPYNEPTVGEVTIQGNLIGTNAQGTAAIGNPEGGIYATGNLTRLLIGGPEPGARNVISGNGRDALTGQQVLSAGIELNAAAPNGITVQGNFIGTGSDGITPIPNRISGINVSLRPNTIYTIGGTNAGEGNVIAGNASHGIQVTDGPGGPVAVLGNSMFSNGGLSIFGGGLGIDLQGAPENSFNVTSNDACDADTGPNGLQNYPVLATADSSAAGTSIVGSLNSKASTAFRIELFSSPTCDGSGKGEGRTFIGTKTVTTAGDCNGAFGDVFQPTVAVGQFITATATDPNGNTSEFSNCVPVTGVGPVPTFTAASTPTAAPTSPGSTPAVTPSPTGPAPTRTPAPENCYDCIDNDDDGAVDRDDPECPQRANGMQLGLSRPGKGAKTIAKCAKTLGKAGLKFSGARLKHLQQCVNVVFACVQQKPNDAACVAKAQKTCGKELGKAAGDESKLRKAIVKACASPAVDLADLRSVAGIGYDTELAVCAERGVGTLASASDVADCLIAQHGCRTEDLVASEVPRAVELLRLAGRDPSVEFPCLVAGVDGASSDLGTPKGKLAVKCQKAIGKAGAKFASLKAKLTQKCLSAVYVCVQVKTTDPKCRPKATATCNKQRAKLAAPGTGATAKLAAAITKGCTKAPLVLTDLLTDAGLGFAAHGGECAALGVPSLDSLAEVTTCLERRHTCRVEQMIETEMPRVEELLDVTP